MKTFMEWLKLEFGDDSMRGAGSGMPSKKELEDALWQLGLGAPSGRFPDYQKYLQYADALEEAGYPEVQQFRSAVEEMRAASERPQGDSMGSKQQWQGNFNMAQRGITNVRSKVMSWLKTGQATQAPYTQSVGPGPVGPGGTYY